MPSLRTMTAFTVGHTYNIKVYGTDLANCVNPVMDAGAPGLAWTNVSINGQGPNHVNIHATLGTTFKEERVTETTGDLTITVTDPNTPAPVVGQFPVVYLP